MPSPSKPSGGGRARAPAAIGAIQCSAHSSAMWLCRLPAARSSVLSPFPYCRARQLGAQYMVMRPSARQVARMQQQAAGVQQCIAFAMVCGMCCAR